MFMLFICTYLVGVFLFKVKLKIQCISAYYYYFLSIINYTPEFYREQRIPNKKLSA